MPAQYIKAGKLFRDKPATMCSQCGEGVGDAPENQQWTIWNWTQIYCLRCSRELGIDK